MPHNFSCITLLSLFSFSLFCAPSFIFVHGAHGTAAGFTPLINELKTHFVNDLSIESVAIDLPGRHDTIDPSTITLDSSAAALCLALQNLPQATLVVHSQAGAIALHALRLCKEKITSIVFLAAVMPHAGKAAFDALSEIDGENYFSGITEDKEASLLRIIDMSNFVDAFAQDANDEQRQLIEENSVDEPLKIGGQAVDYETSWLNSIRIAYISTQFDKIIGKMTQDNIIKSHARIEKVYTIPAGHLPMVTAPKLVAEALVDVISR